jgi:hypothetical protein
MVSFACLSTVVVPAVRGMVQVWRKSSDVHVGTRAADKRYARSIYVLPSVWSNRGAKVEVGTCDNSRLRRVDGEDVLG